MVYCDPQPRPSAIGQHYDVPPEEYWDASRLQGSSVGFSEHIEKFSRLGGVAGRALDVGAGLGHGVSELTRAGFDAWGLEPSKSFVERARLEAEIEPERLIQSSIEDAEFGPNQFSLIWFGAVLEHLYDPSGALIKALAWLKPGGLVYIDVPSARFLSNRIVNLAYRLQGLDYVANLSPMHPPFHLYEFTPRAFTEHARIYGHELASHRVHVTAETYLPFPGLMRWLMRGFDAGMQLEVWLRKPVA